MRTEPYHLPRTITVTVTTLRAHLFEVFDLVADHDVTAVIIYKGSPLAQIVYDGPAEDKPMISPGLSRALKLSSSERDSTEVRR